MEAEWIGYLFIPGFIVGIVAWNLSGFVAKLVCTIVYSIFMYISLLSIGKISAGLEYANYHIIITAVILIVAMIMLFHKPSSHSDNDEHIENTEWDNQIKG